jgi:hypothetical protein
MKIVFVFMAAAFFAVWLMALSPGQATAQRVFEACGEDVANHCEAVTPGNGRIFACLYAHEDKISESCDAVIVDVANQLDLFFELIRYTKQECRADIEKHCMDVEMGGGRIYTCLKSHKAELTSDCSTVVESINLPSDQPG